MSSQLFFQDLSVKFWYYVITAKVLTAIEKSLAELSFWVRSPNKHLVKM